MGMQRIKDSGKAGVIAYALTEGAFWIGSVPFAIAAVTLATGSLPDFARLIVPARIAFALGLAPWVDENIVKKFGGDEQEEQAAAASAPPIKTAGPGCHGRCA